MSSARHLLQQMDGSRFADVVAASPKTFREELFRTVGIKPKGGGAFTLNSAGKNLYRVERLHEVLRGDTSIADGILEELIRNHLFTRRALLADALDHLGVPHDDGLTDSDLGFMTTLSPDKVSDLRQKLGAKHDPTDVELYFAIMSIPVA